MEEFEIKFLEVDVPELEKKLLSIGAIKVGEYNYKRATFDYPDWRMNNVEGAWLRLRTDGKETTLTYKKLIKGKENWADTKEGRVIEIETRVEDYDKTYQILLAIGLIIKREEENKRIRYKKGGIVYDIDIWPLIPPYIEIESDSYETCRKAAIELGFDPKDEHICPASVIYSKYGINKNEYSFISFDRQIKK